MSDNTIDNVAKIGIKFETDKASLRQVKEQFASEMKNIAKENSSIINNTVGKSLADTIKNANKQGGITQNVQQFKSYQQALSDLERKAANVYRQLQTLDKTDYQNKVRLNGELAKIREQYQALNKESANFRKNIGISNSRGFYDLNSNIDYFKSKARSKFAMMTSERLIDSAFSLPENIMSDLQQLEQAKVNFAQVMPDSFTNNQNAMNQAMREFIQVAADYGTSVEDVTEAGRLWGRQYKDIGIIQELVRNSTKLSITDNMSLVDVNKALEATIQQYGISLKTAAEAQKVSGDYVDKWSHLADTALVTAMDLAKANEQSASAAHQAGIGFDFLQGMITTMAAKTGKSGAEVGRSIRSMLVSMNTAKARKEFAKLGISLETLDKDGVKHVRNMEQVIIELMQKLKTTKLDIRDTITAMSGGKMQYNNVLALLTAYDELQKNINLSKNSAGWADQQVALQTETISRQLQGLKADYMAFINTLSQAGATEGLKDIIKILRETVQVISSIDPKNLDMIYSTMKALVALRAGLYILSVTLVQIPRQFTMLSRSIMTLPARITATTSAVRGLAMALSLATKAAGAIGMLLTVLQVGYTLYDAYNSKQTEAAEKARLHAENVNNEISQLNTKQESLKTLSEQLESNRDIMAKSTKDSEEYKKADSEIIKIKDKIIDILDDEGKAKVLQSDFAKSAIDSEITKLNSMATAYQADKERYYQAQEEKTNKLIAEYNTRLSYYESEANLLGAMLDNIGGLKSGIPEIFGNRADELISEGKTAIQEQIERNNTERENIQKAITEEKARNIKLKAELQKARELSSKSGNNAGAIIDDSNGTGGKGSGGSGNSDNYAAKAERLQYQKQRNELWYDGKIAATVYDTALKELNNTERMEGVTAKTSIGKMSLWKARQQELEQYKTKLVDFRSELEKALDERMSDNQQIAKQLGYTSDMTTEQKLRIMEVNKETFQEMKSFTEISKLISEVNSKIAETDNSLQDVNNTLAQTKLSMNPEDVYSRKAEDLKLFYDKLKADNSGYFNPFGDINQNMIQLDYLNQLYQAQVERTRQLRENLSSILQSANENDVRNAQIALDKAELAEKQTAANIRQARLDSFSGISESLYGITTDLLIEGKSWKDIWKNLWKDLAKRALESLFKMQIQIWITGLLMKLFGLSADNGVFGFGASPSAFAGGFTGGSLFQSGGIGAGFAEGGSVKGAGSSKSDSIPAMLSNGEYVLNADTVKRLGVPLLNAINQNKGIIAKFSEGGYSTGNGVEPVLSKDFTAKHGESVSDVLTKKDIDTNQADNKELLAAMAVTMRELAEQGKAPSNVNIMAMDSKSFAEFLNENSDILMGVLAKNHALNRK